MPDYSNLGPLAMDTIYKRGFFDCLKDIPECAGNKVKDWLWSSDIVKITVIVLSAITFPLLIKLARVGVTACMFMCARRNARREAKLCIQEEKRKWPHIEALDDSRRIDFYEEQFIQFEKQSIHGKYHSTARQHTRC